MSFYYRVIDDSSVDPEIRGRARAVLEHCKKALGLASVEIEWVVPVSEAEYRFASGLYKLEKSLTEAQGKSFTAPRVFETDPAEFFGQNACFGSWGNKVRVRADIPLKEVLLTVAHELHHFHFSQIYRPPFTKAEKDAWEREAERYAMSILLVS